MTARDSTKNVFYTYAHYRAAAPERGPFYIGKGKGSRAWKTSGTGRNLYWQRVAKKHGLLVEIIAVWPTEQEALDHEVFLISCFRDMGTGIVNMTDGGDGLSNPSPEVREKLSKAFRLLWQDDEWRAKVVAGQNTPEAIARKRESLKRAFSQPGYRERQSEIIKRSHARPEVKAKILANAADPAYRQKLSDSVRAALAKPESKQRKSAASKAMWLDPSHAESFAKKVRASTEKRWATQPVEQAEKNRRWVENKDRRKVDGKSMTKREAGLLAGAANRAKADARRALLPPEERARLEKAAADRLRYKNLQRQREQDAAKRRPELWRQIQLL